MSAAREILIRRTILKYLAGVPGLPMRQSTLRGYVEIDVDRMSGEEMAEALKYLKSEKLIIGVSGKVTDQQWRITALGSSVLEEEVG